MYRVRGLVRWQGKTQYHQRLCRFDIGNSWADLLAVAGDKSFRNLSSFIIQGMISGNLYSRVRNSLRSDMRTLCGIKISIYHAHEFYKTIISIPMIYDLPAYCQYLPANPLMILLCLRKVTNCATDPDEHQLFKHAFCVERGIEAGIERFCFEAHAFNNPSKLHLQQSFINATIPYRFADMGRL